MLPTIITIIITSVIVMLLPDTIGIFSIFKSIFLRLGEINHPETCEIKKIYENTTKIFYFSFYFSIHTYKFNYILVNYVKCVINI